MSKTSRTEEIEAGRDPAPVLDRATSERVVALLDPEVLGDVRIDLAATLGRCSLTMQKLASMESGEVVTLDTPLNGIVDLSLNGRRVARGEIVAVGDRFGVRVSEILTRKQ